MGAFKRLVGGHAAQLLTRGALMDPATAFRIGLVDELCERRRGRRARTRNGARILRAAARAMLTTRALARRDLIDLYGKPGQDAAPRARVRRDGGRDMVRAGDAGAPQAGVREEELAAAGFALTG